MNSVNPSLKSYVEKEILPRYENFDKDKLIEQLYKTIGELTMSVEFLKSDGVQGGELSIRQQCVLLSPCRATFYYTPSKESDENLEIMKLLDSQYLKTPFY